MLSFINEIDDPIVQKDILDLNRRILLYKEGGMDEERFEAFALRAAFTAKATRRSNDPNQGPHGTADV